MTTHDAVTGPQPHACGPEHGSAPMPPDVQAIQRLDGSAPMPPDVQAIQRLGALQANLDELVEVVIPAVDVIAGAAVAGRLAGTLYGYEGLLSHARRLITAGAVEAATRIAELEHAITRHVDDYERLERAYERNAARLLAHGPDAGAGVDPVRLLLDALNAVRQADTLADARFAAADALDGWSTGEVLAARDRIDRPDIADLIRSIGPGSTATALEPIRAGELVHLYVSDTAEPRFYAAGQDPEGAPTTQAAP